ncbi:ABC transporter ATP-binding protein [Phenylobacterium sp.]|uniref:ABC transporter ATP-binding protein n=1 Tax=Phenylobacterium sp. TaxID=1871053 RepID=UPI00273762EB|nr:ABC transporter ATP-binding protein [Phenylobacterium sp.]MDP3853318.1 ABC transporter ATP-binding protein [Phenylobacterium sp.]
MVHAKPSQLAPLSRGPGANRDDPLITMRQVGKTYETPAGTFAALADIELTLARGDFVAVVGKSGSGKTTLINLLTGIDRPTSGSIDVAGDAVVAMSETQLAAWRGKTVGLVFQFFQLLPTLTIAENVILPMDFCATYPVRERRPRALDLLSQVGIADQADKLPATLSGGQQQRAAIARALANDPPLLVADEPTGNLDSHTADEILALFSRLAAGGTTVVIVSHERDVAAIVDRTIVLVDGRIASDTASARARAVPQSAEA